MGKKRKVFFAFAYDFDGIEKFLEAEAAKGWMLKKCSGSIYTFEKCEPKKLKFQINFFDSNIRNGNTEYLEYIEETGWKYVYTYGKMQIFCSELEEIIPIHTDQEIKYNIIKKKGFQNVFYLLIFLIFSQFNIFFVSYDLWFSKDYYSFGYQVSNPLILSAQFAMIILIIFIIFNVARFGLFYFRNQKNYKLGMNIKYPDFKSTNRINATFKITYLIMLLFYFFNFIYSVFPSFNVLFLTTLICALFAIVIKLAYKKVFKDGEAPVLIIISVICIFVTIGLFVYNLTTDFTGYRKLIGENSATFFKSEELEMTLLDLGISKPENFLYEVKDEYGSRSIFAEKTIVTDFYLTEKGEELGYNIHFFSSEFQKIIDKYNNLVLNNPNFKMKKIGKEDFSNKIFDVYSGETYNKKVYVLLGQGETIIVDGDLNMNQALQLALHFIN